jgi:anti-anti-sigma factor
VVSIEGPLRLPINRELRHKVRALLCRGERRLVLDLTQVSRIDAAGVGELVRAYNMTAASNGMLRVAHATARVTQILERVGLFNVLTGGFSVQNDCAR